MSTLLLLLSIQLWSAPVKDSSSVLFFEIPYSNHPIHIDGSLKDWKSNAFQPFSCPTWGDPYDNEIHYAFRWDREYLYGCFLVFDHRIVGLESDSSPSRIVYNDGIEVYIDALNDSKDTIDQNDYQFVADFMGQNAVFRGDRLNRFLKHRVPKEEDSSFRVFKTATSFIGTSNNNHDIDSAFIVELAIPWIAIRLNPSTGGEFKLDVCVNDNDTLVDFHQLPPGPVELYTNFSVTGTRDFGYPADWIAVRLTGKANILNRILPKYYREGAFFTLALVVIFILFVTWSFLRFRQLRRIPKRNSPDNEKLLEALTRDYPVRIQSLEQKMITKARLYLEKNIQKPVQSEELAAELAMSTRTLQRLFRAQLNTTPGAFIVLFKMEHAADLIRQGSLTIYEVAEATGFSDPGYFSRVFKKYFNMTPKEYLNRASSSGS